MTLLKDKIKEKTCNLANMIDRKFMEQFGFRIKKTTFSKIVEYLHMPKDSSSLAVARILFGLAMLFDIPDERGGAIMDRRWGENKCHFPLFPFITALPMPYMAAIYAIMWFGALGIMLGYKYRISSVMFTVSYWYLFLIEKSFWNNHSYLFGLVALLMSCTQAHCFWSIDAYLDPSKASETVPYWNYFLLKYQFFILYFMAGMKKSTAEWLTGYSVQKLSEHWVFDPFKFFLTVPQIDYLIVHWFIFLFDLTVAVWMMWKPTRHVAMIFCAMFHLMNTRLFRIGMFPWVCLATMPLYYPFDWPKKVLHFFQIRGLIRIETILSYHHKIMDYCSSRASGFEENKSNSRDQRVTSDESTDDDNIEKVVKEDEDETEYDSDSIDQEQNTKNQFEFDDSKNLDETNDEHHFKNISEKTTPTLTEIDYQKSIKNVTRSEILTTYLIIIYVILQAFLPYSHFITKGYNNWTNGLYGYSWDMMVHTWDTQSVIVKVKDNENNREFYIQPNVYSPNDRWTRHGDMVYQYAHCINQNLLEEREKFTIPDLSKNLSIYFDVWCSMNGRFTQRLFDPKVDILRTSWSPLQQVSFLMPLLDEAIHWRSNLEGIIEEVNGWSNKSDVIFFADFPNYEQDKFIPTELNNVSLTILKGDLAFEQESTLSRPGLTFKMTTWDSINVDSGLFHKVKNIGDTPVYYMYTFFNNTESTVDNNISKMANKLPILTELYIRFKGMFRFGNLLRKSLLQMINLCNGKC